jgi:hypothetical protein
MEPLSVAGDRTNELYDVTMRAAEELTRMSTEHPGVKLYHAIAVPKDRFKKRREMSDHLVVLEAYLPTGVRLVDWNNLAEQASCSRFIAPNDERFFFFLTNDPVSK